MLKRGTISILLLLASNLVASYSLAKELTVKTNMETKIFSVENLLSHKALEKFNVEYDPAYGHTSIQYKAVPIHVIFSGLEINPESIIQFKAVDGFSAPLPTKKLLNKDEKKSIAYVAIEDPRNPWPNMKTNKSAGPFYLIWKNPRLSDIGKENWPYMLAGFEVKSTLEVTYPKIFPDSVVAKDSDIYTGMNSYVKNCFPCHKLNGQGDGTMGPDLNQPMNPTEYFKENALKKFIRNPESVRTWPNRVMYGFAPEFLPETELNALISYLKHMADRKI